MNAEMWPEEPAAVRDLLENKYWIDELYDHAIVRPLRALSDRLRVFDKVAVDGAVFVVGFLPKLFGWMLRPFQSGNLQSYSLFMLAGLAVIALAVLRSLS
jgi:NADH-quinone oxidoreductase subunit L